MARDDPVARHRVLIVDDEESTRLLLARMLSKELKVEAQGLLAGAGELRLADNYAYDAIMLDLLMPGIGGLGVLREIRASSANTATPVIIVSVVSDKDTIQRCMAAGANAFHHKPVRRAELVETLRKQLAARRKPRNSSG